jgi:hypothetical protein
MVPSVAKGKFPRTTPPGIDPETVRLVAQCLNHYVTPGPLNTVVSIIILYYNVMGPPSYMRSVVDRNVVMRRMTVHCHLVAVCLHHTLDYYLINGTIFGKKLKNTKFPFWYYLQLLTKTFLITGVLISP